MAQRKDKSEISGVPGKSTLEATNPYSLGDCASGDEPVDQVGA